MSKTAREIVATTRSIRREKLEPLSVEDTIILVEGIRAFRDVLKEASDYLDTNNKTNIAHGSILHQTFRNALEW